MDKLDFEKTFSVKINVLAIKTVIVKAETTEEAMTIVNDDDELENYKNGLPSKIRRIDLEEYDEEIIQVDSEGLL